MAELVSDGDVVVLTSGEEAIAVIEVDAAVTRKTLEALKSMD